MFMPDFFDGKPADISWYPPDTDDKGKKLGEFFSVCSSRQEPHIAQAWMLTNHHRPQPHHQRPSSESPRSSTRSRASALPSSNGVSSATAGAARS